MQRRRSSVGFERRASDRKVAGLMLEVGITSLSPWERHNANFLIGSLCGVEDSTGVCKKI